MIMSSLSGGKATNPDFQFLKKIHARTGPAQSHMTTIVRFLALQDQIVGGWTPLSLVSTTRWVTLSDVDASVGGR